MNREEITQLFEQQAPHYDTQWEKMAPINDGMYFLIETLVSDLPSNARILCVGAGTGREVIFLARRFKGWDFTVVEPSGAMLNLCRELLEKEGIASRCHFHEGYLDTLSMTDKHDAATCFNVSHFILDREQRTTFFAEIAHRLKPNGLLISSDLSFDTRAENYQSILTLWFRVMSDADISAENIERMKNTYKNDVAILPLQDIISIFNKAGFKDSTPFYQAGLIQAYFSRRNAYSAPS
ncbi:class I SAM-dependent methyltransferase [Teredinibacter purpureus]|uniref:class I SAM-dependent methyltransferase n=1 Tax=Teredinibacter purpureus TaxID=2731756 RepID=UPI0005F80B82|nr:class I SAM-dependent methyltransferase [Teredinibacter purpureus]